MPITDQFMTAVEELRHPVMGTETIGPLLYHLIRVLKPQRVLEIGMGYTSCFIVQALADNRADYERQRAALAKKTDALLSSVEGGKLSRQAANSWFEEEPAYADPTFYRRDHSPRYYGFDDLSEVAAFSGAARVPPMLERLGLSSFATIHQADAFRVRELVPESERPFDLFFSDGAISPGLTSTDRDFFAEFWDLIDPQGGLFVAQSLENSVYSEWVLARLKLMQATTHFNDLELLSLPEPHKLRQSGLFVVKRLSGRRVRLNERNLKGLIDEAAELLDE